MLLSVTKCLPICKQNTFNLDNINSLNSTLLRSLRSLELGPQLQDNQNTKQQKTLAMKKIFSTRRHQTIQIEEEKKNLMCSNKSSCLDIFLDQSVPQYISKIFLCSWCFCFLYSAANWTQARYASFHKLVPFSCMHTFIHDSIGADVTFCKLNFCPSGIHLFDFFVFLYQFILVQHCYCLLPIMPKSKQAILTNTSCHERKLTGRQNYSKVTFIKCTIILNQQLNFHHNARDDSFMSYCFSVLESLKNLTGQAPLITDPPPTSSTTLSNFFNVKKNKKIKNYM